MAIGVMGYHSAGLSYILVAIIILLENTKVRNESM